MVIKQNHYNGGNTMAHNKLHEEIPTKTQGKRITRTQHDRFAGENPYDPIQRVIDHQLAIPWCGEWYDRTKKKNESYISPTISRGSSAMDKKDDIENRLLGAIEWKQNRRVRDWRIYRTYLNGFTQKEVGEIYELSQQHVSRIIRKLEIK